MSARPALLYLTHRIPYPPNKGDKVRSFNLLRQLAASHRVFLGTFIDDPADTVHVPALAEWCEVGIDLEQMRVDLPYRTMAQQFFHAANRPICSLCPPNFSQPHSTAAGRARKPI